MMKAVVVPGGLAFSLLVAAALPAAGLAKERAAETLTRTSKWVVNYDKDACHLLAQFGPAEDPLVMQFTRYELGDWFDMSLYGRKLATTDFRSETTVDFGLGGPPVKAQALNGKADKLPLMMFSSIRLDGWQRKKPEDIGPSVLPQQEAAVSGLTVKVQRRKAIRLQFGSLAKPMEQFRTCQSDLLKSWGYDPAVQTTLAKPARPVGWSMPWLRDSDYPSGAIAMGQNGVVQYRLDVEANGKVSGCHVLARTSPDVFADTTCRAVTGRAKLDPALDAAGKPVRSFFVQKVRWQMAE